MMIKKSTLLLLVLIVAAVATAGCGQAENHSDKMKIEKHDDRQGSLKA